MPIGCIELRNQALKAIVIEFALFSMISSSKFIPVLYPFSADVRQFQGKDEQQ